MPALSGAALLARLRDAVKDFSSMGGADDLVAALASPAIAGAADWAAELAHTCFALAFAGGAKDRQGPLDALLRCSVNAAAGAPRITGRDIASGLVRAAEQFRRSVEDAVGAQSFAPVSQATHFCFQTADFRLARSIPR